MCVGAWACDCRRCRTVVRRPQPESEWNRLQLPSVNNFVDSQRWQVSPIYFWFDECTCTKVRNRRARRRCDKAQQSDLRGCMASTGHPRASTGACHGRCLLL